MPSRRAVLSVVFVSVLSLSVLGCGKSTGSKGAQLRVVCTTGMVADIVKNVGGKHVSVEALMGAGVDPHLYKANVGDSRKLADAQIVFASGKHLESASMRNALEGIKKRNKPVYEVTEALPKEDLLMADAEVDPHIWHNVELWRRCVEVVYDGLRKLKPELEAEFKKNREAYEKRLSALHESTKKKIEEIPEEQRYLVTAHDAFSYYAKAYGLTQKSIQGISTTDEASVKKINELVDFLVKHKIKAIFVESSVPQKTIQSLQEGCQSKGHKVVIGGELHSDALGSKGDAATYEGMIKHNTETIVKALK